LGVSINGVTGEQADLNEVNDIAAQRWQGLGESMMPAIEATERASAATAILGENARIAAKGLGSMIDSTNRNVGSAISEMMKDVEWLAAGGGRIEQAFSDIKGGLVAGWLTKDDGLAMMQGAFLASTALQLQLNQITGEQAAQNIAETLGMKLSEALAIVKQMKDQTFDWTVYVDYVNTGAASPGAGTYYPGGQSNPPAKKTALGGPVMSGGAYIVGERGPEMFVPNQSGNIISNNQLRGATMGGSNTDAALLAAILNLPSNISRAVRDGIVRVAG
jgi:hypothetical protein